MENNWKQEIDRGLILLENGVRGLGSGESFFKRIMGGCFSFSLFFLDFFFFEFDSSLMTESYYQKFCEKMIERCRKLIKFFHNTFYYLNNRSMRIVNFIALRICPLWLQFKLQLKIISMKIFI